MEQNLKRISEELKLPQEGRERIRKCLTEQQPARRRSVRPLRTALLAAAMCMALMVTALAASPGLREMLAAALGAFAPYAQEQEGEAYVIDGVEFRVVSALADDFTVRAYVEARDLEDSRLSGNMTVLGMVDIPRKKTGEGVSGFTMGAACLGYDEEAGTALLAVTSWGQVMADDLSGSAVRLFALSAGPGLDTLWENDEGVTIPVDVKPMGSTVLTGDTALASGLQAEEVRLSALSVSIICKGDGAWHALAGLDAGARLRDGTVVEAPWEGGQGNFGTYSTESERKVLVWNFREPVEVESIEGIYVGERYFSMS